MALSKPDSQDVIDLTGTALDSGVVSALIDDAALIGKDCLESLTDEYQKAALKWLAAHMVASTSDQSSAVLTSNKLGDASKSWARGQMGTAIQGTTYGQQAVALVPCLARLGTAKASVEVV